MQLKETRVAFFCDAIFQRNGVGTYYGDLFDHLQQHLANIDLIGPQLQGPSPFQGWSFPLPGDPTQQVFLPKFKTLFDYFRSHSPHLVVIPIPAFYGLAGFSIARRLQIPVVVGYHTHYGELIEMMVRSCIKTPIRLLIQKWHRFFFRVASTVVVNSGNMADSARSLGARQIDIVGTPVSRLFLEPVGTLSRAATEHIIFAGRLSPEKNIHEFIAAAEVLPGRRFTIVGDGPLRTYVQENAARLPNLSHIGWCDRPTLMTLIDRSDLLVLPSRVEGFGTIALEAMARETSVLVSRECGLLEWPAIARYVFVKEKAEPLAGAICRVLEVDRSTRHDLAVDSLGAVRKFHQETILQWLAIIRNSIQTRLKPDHHPGA